MSRSARWKHSLVVAGSIAAGIAALALIGCGGGGGTTNPQTATSAVTPQAGGTVTLPDNSARLEIPAGAVSSTTMITVSASDAAAPSGVTVDGQILKFEPDGLVFSKPVTVTFTIKSAAHPTVYWSNASGGFDAIGGTVTGTSIAAQVMHFSSGFVGEVAGAPAACAPGQPCEAGKACSYGGAPLNGGGGGTNPGTGGKSGGSDPPGTADAGVASGGGTSGGGAPLDPGSPAPTTGKLSSGSDTGGTSPGGPTSSVAMCCACGPDGKLACSTCGGATNDVCGEGAACGAAGSTCRLGGGSSGGADAGMPSSGGGAAPLDPGSPAPTTGKLSSATCCTCGADGRFHCSDTCTTGPGPIGSADAGAPPPADGGGGGTIDPGAGNECLPGGACTSGGAGCKSASPSSCLACECFDGHYRCMPCAGADDPGAPPPRPDGGAPPPPDQECVPGAPCAAPGVGCGGGAAGSCMKCMCGDDLKLACTPC